MPEPHDAGKQEHPADKYRDRDRRHDRDEDGVDARDVAEQPDRQEQLPVAGGLLAQPLGDLAVDRDDAEPVTGDVAHRPLLPRSVRACADGTASTGQGEMCSKRCVTLPSSRPDHLNDGDAAIGQLRSAGDTHGEAVWAVVR